MRSVFASFAALAAGAACVSFGADGTSAADATEAGEAGDARDARDAGDAGAVDPACPSLQTVAHLPLSAAPIDWIVVGDVPLSYAPGSGMFVQLPAGLQTGRQGELTHSYDLPITCVSLSFDLRVDAFLHATSTVALLLGFKGTSSVGVVLTPGGQVHVAHTSGGTFVVHPSATTFPGTIAYRRGTLRITASPPSPPHVLFKVDGDIVEDADLPLDVLTFSSLTHVDIGDVRYQSGNGPGDGDEYYVKNVDLRAE